MQCFSFNLQYLLLPWRPYSSCLRLLIRLRVPYIFHSVTCLRKQFLRKMWPIQFAFLHCFVCRMFVSSLTVQYLFISHTISLTDLCQSSPAPHFKTFESILIYALHTLNHTRNRDSSVSIVRSDYRLDVRSIDVPTSCTEQGSGLTVGLN